MVQAQAFSSSLADTGIKLTELVGSIANTALRLERGAMPLAELVAPLVPYGPAVIAAIKIADPIIAKIAAAAPVVSGAIEAGRPAIDAAQAVAPSVLPHLKDLLAIAINHDPSRPETGLTAADIGDGDAMAFAGPVLLGRPWTKAEVQRWYDRAQGSDYQ